MPIIKMLIANLTGLYEKNEDLFKTRMTSNLVENIFNLTNKTEISSAIAFSAYKFLLTICDDKQIEIGFKRIPDKYEKYLDQSARDFRGENKIPRDKREIMIDKQPRQAKFYELDFDKCGSKTTLDLILVSLGMLSSKHEKFRTMILKTLKTNLDVILEKGNSYEKRLVLDIYIEISLDSSEEMRLTDGIVNSIGNDDKYSEILEKKLKLLERIHEVTYEPKKSTNHDLVKLTNILISFDSPNKTKCDELKNRLVEKLMYNVFINDIEGVLILSYLKFII